MLSVNRRARLLSVVALGAALICPVQAQQAKLPKILSDPATAAANPLPDFSYAGYGFGLTPIPVDAGTIVEVTDHGAIPDDRSEEHTSELQSLMRISYAVFCLKKKNK